MTSKGKIERWLLADWNGDRLLKSSSMIRVTEEVNVTETTHRAEIPKSDMTSDGGNSFEGHRVLKTIENGTAGMSESKNEERDYSPSASSWEPSGDECSSDSPSEYDMNSERNSYTKQYSNKSNNKSGPKPVHRPNPVIANILKASQLNGNRKNGKNRKRANKDSFTHLSVKKYSADSTRRNHTPPVETQRKTANINVQEIEEIKAGFQELFKMLNDLKPQPKKFLMEPYQVLERPPTEKPKNTLIGTEDYDEHSERSDSVLSDRSDDNVLISNKYHRVAQDLTPEQNKCEFDGEWVPIGSGKTMIHKDKFRKVNWKSYTIATRTLLLAAFPRRILATHSLTGKRSPAFQNKPAKMCLDPKIVSDIILEITSRFKVKENLVRTIITTKCADECKMFKIRLKSNSKSLKNDENAQPKSEEKEK